MVRTGQRSIIHLDEMKIKLKKHFFAHDFENLYDQLVKLEQERLLVHECMELFNGLTIRCGVDEGDKQSLSRF